MTRYYFDLRDRRGFHHDGIGDEFESFDEVKAQAQAVLAHVIREELPGGNSHTVTCDVRDETGSVVYHGELTFRGTARQAPQPR